MSRFGNFLDGRAKAMGFLDSSTGDDDVLLSPILAVRHLAKQSILGELLKVTRGVAAGQAQCVC